MSALKQVNGQIDEMFRYLDSIHINVYNVVLISLNMYKQLVEELRQSNIPIMTPTIMCHGFQRLSLETVHTTFFLDACSDITNGDICMTDIHGNRYGYQEYYLNEMIETLLHTGTK